MQEYIEGEFFETGRPEHFLEAARVLAQYHLAVDGFSDDLALTSRPAYDPQFILNSLQKLEQLWNLAGSRCASHQLAQLQGQCADLDVRFAAHGALPRLLIHGDYYADNLLFAAHRIVGVVDYDKFRLDARVVEVAEALIYFASPQVHHLQHLVYPGVLQWASLKQFLEAYCQVSSLGAEEAQALPDYVGCVWLQMSLLRLLEQPPAPGASHCSVAGGRTWNMGE